MPAPAVPQRGFLGLGLLLEVLKANREERGPKQFVEAMNEVGRSGEVHTVRLECESPVLEHPRMYEILDTEMNSAGL